MKVPSRHALPIRPPNGLPDRLRSLPAGVRWTGVALLVLSVFFISWLGYEGYQAKSNLEQAKISATQTKDALLSSMPDDAARFAEISQFHARQAQRATHSLPWNAAAAIPLLGSPLKTTQQMSDVVVGLADNVLLPGAKMGGGLSPDKMIDGNRLNLKLLSAEQPRLTELAAAAADLDAQAQAIARPSYFSPVTAARSQLQDQTSRLAQLLANTAIGAALAPSMMGGDGPRTYLMAFQNNAEARGTGGLLGGFGVVRFDNGIPSVDMLAPNTELKEASATVDLGPEFETSYGWMDPFTDYRNSNLSPHFPYAAEIWKSMWDKQSGTPVDGVITVDPVALSYVLGALGPVTLPDGELITQGNVVELTQSTAYVRFAPLDRAPDGMSPKDLKWYNLLPPADRDWYNKSYAAGLRKKYLQEIANAVVTKMTSRLDDPHKLIKALGKAVSEGRIAVWSAHPEEQELLEQTPLSHIVPDDDAPYAQVVINNLAGNKMDYYLEREIEYAADGCKGDRRNSTITVRLTNTATNPQLPDYVSGLQGLASEFSITAPKGTMVTSVRVIATKGSALIGVTTNGERAHALVQTERGHPSFEVQIAIPPGKSGELIFRLSEPTSSGEPRVPIQPLIDEVTPKVSVPACTS